MKKLIGALFLLFTVSLNIQCTNDEGEEDFDIINPTEEETSSETAKQEVKRF